VQLPVPSCIKVPKKSAEEIRKLLLELNLLSTEFRIKVEDEFLLIPLTRELTTHELKTLNAPKVSFTTVQCPSLEKIQTKPNSYLGILKEKFSEDDFAALPRSFDTIGDIVVVEIPDKLWEKRQVIAEAFLKAYSNIKTVYAKTGKVEGVNRIRPVTFLAGEKKTKTIHKEYGLRFAIDITKAYFSPRLSEEHSRIASLVQPAEKVVDLFCGVGPFALPIAKRVVATVYAIDINPEAIALLKENLQLNKLKGKVVPLTGDCRRVVEEENLQGIADRVIMNLPGYAINFLDVACKTIKRSGGIIHFFEFVGGEGNLEEKIAEDVTREILKNNSSVLKVLNVRKVRMSAPRQWQMVADVLIK